MIIINEDCVIYVKTAHWIELEDDKDALICSECGSDIVKRSRYCPDCGAMMEGVEE